MRINKQPGVGTGNGTYNVRDGGVGDLKFISTSLVNQAEGVPLSTANNLLNPAHIDLNAVYYKVSLNGPARVKLNIESSWQITNVNLTQPYLSSTLDGTVTVRNGIVRFKSQKVGSVKFKIDNREFTVFCSDEVVETPVILGLTNPHKTKFANIHSSDFVALNIEDSHDYTEWEMAYDPDFEAIIEESRGEPSHKQDWSLTDLQLDKVYFVRVRYKGHVLEDISEWSVPARIETSLRSTVTVAKPTITYPVTNSNDVPVRPVARTSGFVLNNWEDVHQKSEWEVATDAEFVNVVRTSGETEEFLTEWTAPMLPVNSILFLRARHSGLEFPWSDWSTPITFRTENLLVNKPEIVTPANGATKIPFSTTIQSTPFSKVGTLQHVASTWQVSTNAAFTVVVKSTDFDPVNKTTWTVEGLSPNTTYYVRVKHQSSDNIESDWSSIVTFVTEELRVTTPFISSPANGSNNSSIELAITTSPFASNYTFTHKDTDWQLSANESFTAIVASSNADATNKTSWNPGRLNVSTTYFVRARHRSNTDLTSGWSPVISFTTSFMAVHKPDIVTPANNTQDFGFLLEATASEFGQNGGLAHSGSTWQLSTTPSFSNIVDSVTASATNKVAWSSNKLSPATDYYLRVKYHGNFGLESEWSTTIVFRTMAAKVNTPSVSTPAANAVLPYGNTTFSTSAFTSIGDLTVASTEWEIATDVNFTNVVASTTTTNTNNPLTWKVVVS